MRLLLLPWSYNTIIAPWLLLLLNGPILPHDGWEVKESTASSRHHCIQRPKERGGLVISMLLTGRNDVPVRRSVQTMVQTITKRCILLTASATDKDSNFVQTLTCMCVLHDRYTRSAFRCIHYMSVRANHYSEPHYALQTILGTALSCLLYTSPSPRDS